MLHTQYFPSAFPFLEEFVSHVLVDYFCQLLRYYQAVWTIIFTFIWVLFLAIFCRSIKITFCCLLSTICKEFICEFLPFLAQDTNKFDFCQICAHSLSHFLFCWLYGNCRITAWTLKFPSSSKDSIILWFRDSITGLGVRSHLGSLFPSKTEPEMIFQAISNFVSFMFLWCISKHTK